MSQIEPHSDMQAETTEQALARVEAECGWSDALNWFAQTLSAQSSEPSTPDGSAAA
jgi:hypothetical protein